jgi:hypothetical protein
MRKTALSAAILAALALSGCASLDYAGHAAYVVGPLTQGPDGNRACCSLQVHDGKEYDGRVIQFQTNGQGFSLVVQEGQSKAFKGQGIAAKAATVLPVTGLQDILGK